MDAHSFTAGRKGALLAVAVALCALVLLIAAFAQRQQVRPRRAAVAGAGTTIAVKAGGDLQRALDDARPGDTVVLEAGATFAGTFTLPRKSGDAYITVQSSRAAELPEGERVTHASAPLMPKLVSKGRGDPALQTAPGAHHWRLVGLEIAQAKPSDFIHDLVKLGDGGPAQNTQDKIPHHLTLDRCYIHAADGGELKRGISLQSAHTEILNSRVAGFKVKGQETQAVAGWNGPGPYRIINNYLEGAGISLMFGGGRASVPGLVPSDILVLRNHLNKPPEWRGKWTVKNIFELKNARRVRVEGNLFEHCWLDAQAGYSILFTPRPSDSGEWAVVEDVEFVNNVVRHVAAGVHVSGQDDLYMAGPLERRLRRVRVANNLFYELDHNKWGGDGSFLKVVSGADQLTVEHNTVLHTGWALVKAGGEPTTGFVFRENIARHNEYGVHGDGVGYGNPALQKYLPVAVFAGNVIAKEANAPWNTEQVYPRGNTFPAALRDVGFVDPSTGNYRLSAGSRFRGGAAGKRDAGCDFDALASALKGNASAALAMTF